MVLHKTIVWLFDKPKQSRTFFIILVFFRLLMIDSPAHPDDAGLHGDRIRRQATLLWSRLNDHKILQPDFL